jgi:hypothetical protein
MGEMAEIAALGPPLEPHKVLELGPPAGLAAACRDDKGGEDEGSEAGGVVSTGARSWQEGHLVGVRVRGGVGVGVVSGLGLGRGRRGTRRC